MQLNGKLVLVTGAGSGIGRALAIEGSRRGMTLALCGRRPDKLSETLSLLDASKKNMAIVADVTHAADRAALVDRLRSVWGRLDVLVNNAGIVAGGPLEQDDDAHLEKLIATNVAAPIALTRDLIPLLLVSPPSRVVNIGSVFGDIPFPLFSAYSSTKFALRGFSDALRREFQDRQIGVTYAAPRAVKTDAADALEGLLSAIAPKLDDPAAVAAQIWTAVELDRASVYPAGPERVFVVIQRLFPAIVDTAVRKQMAKLIAK
jgi:short-subunit dehydrogenase